METMVFIVLFFNLFFKSFEKVSVTPNISCCSHVKLYSVLDSNASITSGRL